MSQVEIRLPELSGGTAEQQLVQIRSYLYMLAEQLQVAFDGAERQEQERAASTVGTGSGTAQQEAASFAQIKALILRSAEITEQLGDKISRTLEGRFVAQSQFGTYQQQVSQRISASAQELRQEFSNLQLLESKVAGLESALLEVNASIRTGALYYREDGQPVYGVEIGQQEWENGVIRFRKFARLTSEKLSFFDGNDVEVAYISDRKLHVTEANINGIAAGSISAERFQMGAYVWQLGADGHLSLR